MDLLDHAAARRRGIPGRLTLYIPAPDEKAEEKAPDRTTPVWGQVYIIHCGARVIAMHGQVAGRSS
jgi:hypothetical protein